MNTHIQILAKAEARFVQCRKKTAPNPKAAVEREWQKKKKPTADMVSLWVDEGVNVGLQPGSIGCAVIDIDVPKNKDSDEQKKFVAAEAAAIINQFGPPLADIETPSGGRHLFYKSADEFAGNIKWRSGDFRQSSGYVVMYDIAAVCGVVEKLPDAPLLIVGDFISKFGVAKEVERTGGIREGNWAAGHRNSTLFDLAMVAGVTDDAAAFKTAKEKALDAGLSETEIERTASNGWKVGEAARNRGVMQARNQVNFFAISKALGWRYRHNERAAREEISQAVFYEGDGIRSIVS